MQFLCFRKKALLFTTHRFIHLTSHPSTTTHSPLSTDRPTNRNYGQPPFAVQSLPMTLCQHYKFYQRRRVHVTHDSVRMVDRQTDRRTDRQIDRQLDGPDPCRVGAVYWEGSEKNGFQSESHQSQCCKNYTHCSMCNPEWKYKCSTKYLLTICYVCSCPPGLND